MRKTSIAGMSRPNNHEVVRNRNRIAELIAFLVAGRQLASLHEAVATVGRAINVCGRGAGEPRANDDEIVRDGDVISEAIAGCRVVCGERGRVIKAEPVVRRAEDES